MRVAQTVRWCVHSRHERCKRKLSVDTYLHTQNQTRHATRTEFTAYHSVRRARVKSSEGIDTLPSASSKYEHDFLAASLGECNCNCIHGFCVNNSKTNIFALGVFFFRRLLARSRLESWREKERSRIANCSKTVTMRQCVCACVTFFA